MAAGGDGHNLVATYAAVQGNLRKQFYGDLVDLRGALLNTMSVAPHRASSLHVKMHLIDSALHMLEETKDIVSNAEMAQLMNMSAKVARAVEAWRSRKQPAMQPARAPVRPAHGGAAAGMSLPFAAMEVQQLSGARGPPAAQVTPMPPSQAETDGTATSITSGDRWEFLSELVAGPAALGQLRPDKAQSLPLLDIDWDVPDIKPSGNLDVLLPEEAAAQTAQQRTSAAQAAARAAGARGGAAAQQGRAGGRMSSADVFLARVSGQGDDSAGAGGGESVCQPSPHLQQQPRGISLQRDGPGGGAALTSPRSVATSCQQPEGSCNSGSGGGTTPAESAGMTVGGSVGNPPTGSACPSPGAAMPDSARHSGGSVPMLLSPFGSVIVQRVSPTPALGADVGVGGFGSMQVLPQSGAFGGSTSHSLQPPPQQQAYQPQQQPGPPKAPACYSGLGSAAGGGLGYGGGPAAACGSMQLSAGVGHNRLPSMQYNSGTLVGMQQLGLCDGSMAGMQTGGQPHLGYQAQAPSTSGGNPASPPLSASVSLSQQQAAAMQAAAGRLAAAHQFPHAAMHAGGGLGSLMGPDFSGSYHLPSPFAGSGGNYQQYALRQQDGAAIAQQPANLVCSGGPAGFSAVPMSNQGSMGGLTITTGSQPRIRIATSVGAYQFSFDAEAGSKRHGAGPYGGACGAPDIDASTGSLGSSGRQKRKKT
ncbi:hypothetical protein ABPG75_001505 [Micractinium tetrahymenae]